MSRTGGMQQSVVGRVVVRLYHRLPFARLALRLVTRVEGGQLYSATLRTVLRNEYDVHVGSYSYGSLLTPGHADTRTTIGRYCSIGPNVRRFGASHPLEELSLHPFWYNPKLGFVTPEHDVDRSPCEIGHDVWIGANVTILPGCQRIGNGAVIGAGSVVTRNVDPFTVVAGNPAKTVRERLTLHDRQKLAATAPWELEPSEMLSALRLLRAPQENVERD